MTNVLFSPTRCHLQMFSPALNCLLKAPPLSLLFSLLFLLSLIHSHTCSVSLRETYIFYMSDIIVRNTSWASHPESIFCTLDILQVISESISSIKHQDIFLELLLHNYQEEGLNATQRITCLCCLMPCSIQQSIWGLLVSSGPLG